MYHLCRADVSGSEFAQAFRAWCLKEPVIIEAMYSLYTAVR